MDHKPKILYHCRRCKNLHSVYYDEGQECSIRYGKKDPPETVYRDEDGNYRCRHYSKKW